MFNSCFKASSLSLLRATTIRSYPIALSILAISRPIPPLAPVTKAFNFPYLLVSPSILVLPLPSGLSAAIIPILYLGYHFTRFFTIYPLLFPCDMLK